MLLLVFVGVVVAVVGNGEVVSAADVEEFNDTVSFTSVETRDVIVLLDTDTIVVLDAIVFLEFADVIVLQGVLVVFFVVFMGIHVCLIISDPFSAIIAVGA